MPQNLLSLLEKQLQARSDCLAYQSPNNRALSYSELNRSSRAIAHRLEGNPGTVALLFDREPEAVTSMLGCLRVGRTFLPLDPSHPQERLQELLKEAAPSDLLTSPALLGLAQSLFPNPLVASSLSLDEPFSPRVLEPSTPAYLVYTSGSTGRPKAVLQTQSNLLHFADSFAQTLELQCTDRLTCIPPFAFGAAILDVFAGLLAGASIHAVNLTRLGVGPTREWLRKERVTVCHLVPSLFRRLYEGATPRDVASVQAVDLAGEAMTPADLRLFRQVFPASCRLFNHLGFSEANVASQLRLEPGVDYSLVPVGKGIPGVSLVVLDEEGQPVAPGQPGEIAVVSDHLSPGYPFDPELTRRQFGLYGGRRTFFTGDLGRWDERDGLIVLGRKDSRVKIRGVGVHTLEVEAALTSLPGIREAAVQSTAGAGGELALVAYVVSCGGPRADLRPALARSLPTSMIPSHFEWMQALPRTLNGKLDRRALSRPHLSPQAAAEPGDGREIAMQAIWFDVLGRTGIGVHTDFFSAGGDSLRAAELLHHIEAVFESKLSLTDLMEAPTISQLARRILAPKPLSPPFSPVQRGTAEGQQIYVTPGGGGEPDMAIAFVRLARLLGSGYSLSCLHHCDARGVPYNFPDLVTMVQHYARAIQVDRPQGVITVLGECIGSLVALELGQQLREQGREVRLILIDPPRTGWSLWLRMCIRPWKDEILYHWNSLRRLNGGEFWRALLTRLGRLPGRLGLAPRREPVVEPGGHSDNLRACFRAYRRVIRSYRPKRYDGPVTALISQRWAEKFQPQRAWFRIAPRLKVAGLPGGHISYLKEDAGALAEALRRLVTS